MDRSTCVSSCGPNFLDAELRRCEHSCGTGQYIMTDEHRVCANCQNYTDSPAPNHYRCVEGNCPDDEFIIIRNDYVPYGKCVGNCGNYIQDLETMACVSECNSTAENRVYAGDVSCDVCPSERFFYISPVNGSGICVIDCTYQYGDSDALVHNFITMNGERVCTNDTSQGI